MSIAGKARRKAMHMSRVNALQTFKTLARRFHDALFEYSNEANWAIKDDQFIWVGKGSGPQGAQVALKGQYNG